MCQPLSSGNKKGNVPRQRVGWNLYTLAEPDPRARALCSRRRLSLFCGCLPSTPDNSHRRWHSTLTSVQLYWCGPGGIPSVNREFSKGTPCCKGMSCIALRFNHYLKVWHLIESDLISPPPFPIPPPSPPLTVFGTNWLRQHPTSLSSLLCFPDV